MLFNEIDSFLKESSEKSDFKINIEENGGHLIFSNSGKRGGRKFFTISLVAIKSMLKDIKSNFSKFEPYTNYVEKDWRDLSKYYTDETIKAMATVQTKPLFITISKMVNWANNNTGNSNENLISLTYKSIENTIEKLEILIKYFKPKIKKSLLKFSKDEKGNLDFPYKNILFKGVPGTGKSRAIDNIINDELDIKDKKQNILRVNIHSASSNADLMQGIAITTENKQVLYKEKQGLIFRHIKKACFSPYQPFVLVLEEIQENSLNELIGDLIYLIEDNKRAKIEDITVETFSKNDYKNEEQYEYEYEYEKLIEFYLDNVKNPHFVEIPNLVSIDEENRKMIMPNNLFIFCTSNYRDDKKVIEDNLLRRFEVIEIYPKNQKEMGKDENGEYYFKSKDVSDFLESLNTSILKVMQENHETHPDRFMIGHSIWQNVEDEKNFYQAFSKLVTEFKDIREVEFDTFQKILKECKISNNIDMNIETKNSYFELIKEIQEKIDYVFIN